MKETDVNPKVGDKLRQCSKGRLIYEREWPESGKSTQELLDQWTSPPRLPAAYLAWMAIDCNQSPGYSVKDGIISMKTSTPKTLSSPLTPNQEDSMVTTPILSRQTDRRIVVLKDDKGSSPLSLSMSPDYSKKEKEIRDYEDLWDRKAKNAVESRRREIFEENSRQLEIDQREGLIKLEVDEHKRWEHIQRLAEHERREQEEEILRNVQKIKDNHLNRKKFLDGVVKTVQVKKNQLEEEAKQLRQKESAKRLETLAKIHLALQKTREDLLGAFKSCLYRQHLPEPANKLEDLVSQLKNKADSIIQQAKSSEAALEHIQKLHLVFQQAQNALEYLIPLVDAANEKGELERQEEERQNVLAQEKAAATTTATTTTPSLNNLLPATSPSSQQSKPRGTSFSEEVHIAPEKAFEHYIKLQENLSAVENSIEDLSKNPQMKKYKFDLLKSVNTPVNSIAPVSGEHLRDKLLRLCKLLGGHPVDVGNKRVSAKEHPQGIMFCKHLLAKMLVKKADEQVSSIHESAFAIAMVTVGVWTEHPDLGNLLLAHFYAACPYLVPYYVPQLQGQTNEQHLQAQGYKFVDGTVEKQDKFLKRMSGIMRLFASIMVSSTPRSQSVHPYGIEHAWEWLTNIMNMNPHPDITATLIYDMLEVTGHALYQNYNKQFQKLLHYLLTVYLPKIQAVVLSGGPVARLQYFLEKCIKQGGQISQPDGFLAQNFWYT